MIKVVNEVTIYEIDGAEVTGLPTSVLIVRSHWNRDSLVVLEIDGKQITVAANDLKSAVANATNTRRIA